MLILTAAQKAEPEPAPSAELLAAGRTVLAELAAASAKTKILAADYVQTQTSLLFEEPAVSSGKVFLRADPGTLVMRVAKPEPVWMRSDAVSHQVWHQGKARAERFLFRENDMAAAMLSSLGTGADALEKSFRFLEAEHAEQKGRVLLAPLDERLRTAIVKLELRTVRDATGVWLAYLAYENPELERTEIVFQAPVRNPELTPAELEEIFGTALPAEVQVLTHDLRSKVPAKRGPQ